MKLFKWVNNLRFMELPSWLRLGKGRENESIFSGGDGSCLKEAVVINAQNTFEGIAAEHAFMSLNHGQRGVGYTLELQALEQHGDRYFDVMHIRTADGKKYTYYFDITRFYGK